MPAGSARIESARGGPDDAHAGGILDFLTREAGLNEEAARQWLSELVCVAAEDGRVVGVSSAHPVSLPQVGGRHFWLYRSVLAPDSDERWDALFNSSFEVLGEEFDKSEGTRLGLCVLVDDVAERPPDAIWPETDLMFAGYLDDERQIRLRYFWGAAIAPGLPTSPSLDETRRQSYPLEDRYRIVPLGETGSVSADDVLEFWAREGAIPDGDEDEAKRRVGEVRLVAIEAGEGIAGVSSLYLQRNAQLRMDLWHYRTFVAQHHRMSNLAAQLFFRNRALMDERFVRGEDRRAGGMLFELENERMRMYFNKALWLPADFTFIGENEAGDHVRVHYFPGATVPPPGGAAPD